jgi:hypothetical protein
MDASTCWSHVTTKFDGWSFSSVYGQATMRPTFGWQVLALNILLRHSIERIYRIIHNILTMINLWFLDIWIFCKRSSRWQQRRGNVISVPSVMRSAFSIAYQHFYCLQGKKNLILTHCPEKSFQREWVVKIKLRTNMEYTTSWQYINGKRY